MKTRFSEIPELNEITRFEEITAGWSFDEKYYIEQSNGETFLLRLTPADKVERKQTEREIVTLFNQFDFQMSKVVGSGLLGDKSYILYTWVEGCDLRDVIVSLPEEEQFSLGVEAGKILNAMHTIPVQEKHNPKTNKLPKKIQQLRQYEESNLRIDADDAVIDYVKDNFDLFWSHPPTYRHGDFHTGNMLYTSEGKIGVIDFQRSVCGDRYEDFYKLQMFDVPLSIPFSIGYLKG
ncbi:MAG: phosphotransferase [Thermotogota bacterium]|nr:phosphotransferase [Thermotogota bacterium]